MSNESEAARQTCDVIWERYKKEMVECYRRVISGEDEERSAAMGARETISPPLLPDDVRATLPRLGDVLDDGLLKETNPVVHVLLELDVATGYVWRWWIMAVEGDDLYGISQTEYLDVEPWPHLRTLDRFPIAELAQLRAPNGNAVRRVEDFKPQREFAIRREINGGKHHE